MKAAFFLTTAAACAGLLSSCVFFDWHLGRATVELSQTQKGVDGEKPVGSTMYAPADWEGKDTGWAPPVYAIEVPEVSFVYRSDLVDTGTIFTGMPSGREMRDITPTGKTRWLLVTHPSANPPRILDERPTEATVDGRLVKLVPQPLRASSVAEKLYPTETQHTAWCIPAYVVATPLFALDYCLDLVMNTGGWLVFSVEAAADAFR